MLYPSLFERPKNMCIPDYMLDKIEDQEKDINNLKSGLLEDSSVPMEAMNARNLLDVRRTMNLFPITEEIELFTPKQNDTDDSPDQEMICSGYKKQVWKPAFKILTILSPNAIRYSTFFGDLSSRIMEQERERQEFQKMLMEMEDQRVQREIEFALEVKNCILSSLSRLIEITLLFLIWCYLCARQNLKRYLVPTYSEKIVKLILLWCSGDIEKHPGPSKCQPKDSISTQVRKGENYLCSEVLKTYLGETSKTPRKLWIRDTDFQMCNPTDGKKYSTTYEIFAKHALICILSDCCDIKKVDMTDLRPMVDALTCQDYNRFVELHIIHTSIEIFDRAIWKLNAFVDEKKWHSIFREKGINMDSAAFDAWKANCESQHRDVKAEEILLEALKSILCVMSKKAKDEDPGKKGQNLYQAPPCGWNSNIDFSDPHNGKNRDIRKQKECFQQLMPFCKDKMTMYRPEIEACQKWITNPDESSNLIKTFLLRHEPEKLQNVIQNLKANGMFSNEIFQDKLRGRGIELQLAGLSTEDTTSRTRKRRNAPCSYRPRKKVRTGEEVTTIILNGVKLEIKTPGCTLDFAKLLKENKIKEITDDNKEETNQNTGEDDIGTSVNTSSEQTDTTANSDDCTPSTPEAITDTAVNTWTNNVLEDFDLDLLDDIDVDAFLNFIDTD